MLYAAIKAVISGILVALISEVAKRNPGIGALITALPLISILALIWLWRDTGDPVRLAQYSGATFWYVLPSLPMFLLIPFLLRSGVSFWLALIAGCLLTIGLYLLMIWISGKFGFNL